MLLVVFFVILIAFIAVGICYKKVGPGETFIIYGFGRNMHVVSGPRGCLYIPLLQTYRVLSREPFTTRFEVVNALIREGVNVLIDGSARLKLRDDEDSLRKAAEAMLSKNHRDKVSLINSVIDEAARTILKNVDPKSLIDDRDGCSQAIIRECAGNLDKIGYELQSLAITDVKDAAGYINAVARRITAEKKARLAIEEAYIAREGQAVSSMIKRDAQIQRIGESIEESARKSIDMEKIVHHTEDYFKTMKERLDKGIEKISKNLYSSDEQKDSSQDSGKTGAE